MNKNSWSASSSALNSETVEWCLGLPSVGQRPLTEEESSGLSRQSGLMRIKGCFLGCLGPLGFFLGIAVLACLPLNAAIGAICCILSLTVALPVLLLLSRDVLKRGKGSRGDAAAGVVKRFRGPVRAYEGPLPEPLQEQLLHLDSYPTGVALEIEIEVLPVSQRLWKVNGEDVAGWVSASSSSTAKLPNSARAVAAWVAPLPVATEQKAGGFPIDSRHQGRRDLSPAEIEELTLRIRRVWLSQMWPALLLSAWVIIPLSCCFAFNQPIHVEPSAYFLVAVALLRDYLFIDALRQAKLLKRDAQNRYVKVFRVAQGEDVVIEVLPLSGWSWTNGGTPASWRRKPV